MIGTVFPAHLVSYSCLTPLTDEMGLDFFINGAAISLGDHEIHPKMTLLDYLRTQPGLTGTKISCVRALLRPRFSPCPAEASGNPQCARRGGARPRAWAGGSRARSCLSPTGPPAPRRPTPPSPPSAYNKHALFSPFEVRVMLTRFHRAKEDAARAPSCSPSSTRRVRRPAPPSRAFSLAVSHTCCLSAAAVRSQDRRELLRERLPPPAALDVRHDGHDHRGHRQLRRRLRKSPSQPAILHDSWICF